MNSLKSLHSFKPTEKVQAKTMQLLNIVLLHNQSPEAYVKLFNDMVLEDPVIKLRGENYIELLSFEKIENVDIYEGTIVSYMGVRPNAWFNTRSKEIETIDNGDDLFANTKKTVFYFVPQRHKLCLLSGSSITIQNIKKYVDGASCRILGTDQIHTNFVTSNDDLTEDYRKMNVTRVKLSFNYTNKDFTGGFGKTFDDLAKDDNVSQIDMDISSAADESLLVKDGGMIDSLLSIITNLGNGDAEITGYDILKTTGKSKNKKKSRKIRTASYIKKIHLEFSSLGTFYSTIYNEIITRFKN